jgi:hypothetical protein
MNAWEGLLRLKRREEQRQHHELRAVNLPARWFLLRGRLYF